MYIGQGMRGGEFTRQRIYGLGTGSPAVGSDGESKGLDQGVGNGDSWRIFQPLLVSPSTYLLCSSTTINRDFGGSPSLQVQLVSLTTEISISLAMPHTALVIDQAKLLETSSRVSRCTTVWSNRSRPLVINDGYGQ